MRTYRCIRVICAMLCTIFLGMTGCLPYPLGVIDWESTCSSVMDVEGTIHVSFLGQDGSLMYGRVVDGAMSALPVAHGNISPMSSIVLDNAGSPHILYQQYSPVTWEWTFVHAFLGPEGWTSEMIPVEIPHASISDNALAIDPEGDVHVVCTSRELGTHGTANHVWGGDGSWQSETVWSPQYSAPIWLAEIGTDQYGNLVAGLVEGVPPLPFGGPPDLAVYIGKKIGGTWVVEERFHASVPWTMDPLTLAVEDFSLAVSPAGDAAFSLSLVRWVPPDGLSHEFHAWAENSSAPIAVSCIAEAGSDSCGHDRIGGDVAFDPAGRFRTVFSYPHPLAPMVYTVDDGESVQAYILWDNKLNNSLFGENLTLFPSSSLIITPQSTFRILFSRLGLMWYLAEP